MNSAAKTYNEIFFIDATYKLTDLGIPLYVFMVENSMGGTECAGAGLLVNEDEESQKWLMRSFEARNGGLKPNIMYFLFYCPYDITRSDLSIIFRSTIET